MKPKSDSTPNGRGRPREFDELEALEKAVRVFRERGFQGTSITDLTAGTGLSSGSLYKAFTDKRGVFVAALDHYLKRRNQELNGVLSVVQPAREKLRALLNFYVDSSHFEEGRLGCMVVSTASELATHDSEVALKISQALRRNENRLIELIEQGQVDGSIATRVDPVATARLMLAVLQGLRVLGKARHQAADLGVIVETAMTLLD